MAQITGYSDRTSSYVTIVLAADAGETAWEVEVNREPDFNADESYLASVGAAGNIQINDLVPSTPYYFRARKTNGGRGPWSNVFMASTYFPEVAPNPPYFGFSVVPALLVVPEPVTDLAATNVAAGSDVNNLLNDDPMSVFKINGLGSAITFRTTGRGIDTIAMLGSLANEDVTWRIRTAATFNGVTNAPLMDTGNVDFRISPGIGRRKHYHAFRRLTNSYGTEYWRIDIGGLSQNFIARNLIVGKARESVNISRGQGEEAIDYGSINRTQFGQPDRVRGWRGRKVEFPLSWIRETEYEAKWRDLDLLVGNTDPVLAIPNPKKSIYLNDRIAYGEIASMRGEVMRGDKYARTLEIRSLY